jgi:hypothetical protein
MLNVQEAFTWSDWYPLEGCWHGSTIPTLTGLYRIQRSDRPDLDYIGQTGMNTMNLKERLAMLKGVFAVEMPYRTIRSFRIEAKPKVLLQYSLEYILTSLPLPL